MTSVLHSSVYENNLHLMQCIDSQAAVLWKNVSDKADFGYRPLLGDTGECVEKGLSRLSKWEKVSQAGHNQMRQLSFNSR